MTESTTANPCESSATIPATCAGHEGARVFASLLVEKRAEEIVFDAQISDGPMIILDRVGATALFDLLGAWLG